MSFSLSFLSDPQRIAILLWAVLAVAGLLLLVYVLRAERRVYVSRGKAGAWLAMRLATLPIVAVAAAVVILPARAISGPEALAAFYLLLFTAAPLVFFALHWLVGRIAGLASRDSLALAATGLACVLAPLLAAQFAQQLVWSTAYQLTQRAREFAPERPMPFRVVAGQRFSLAGIGEVWTEQWQAPPGVAIERIELEQRGAFQRVEQGSGHVCRADGGVHLFWHASVPAPRWRVEWRSAEGKLARSTFASSPPTVAAVPFELQWIADGFVLPVRVAREIASIGFAAPGGREQGDTLDRPQPGVPVTDNCLPLEFRRSFPAGAQLTSLQLRLWRPDTQQMEQAVLRRPSGG